MPIQPLIPKQDEEALEKSNISAADIKFLFGQPGRFGLQCGEGEVLHVYDFKEFILLESGSAFGKGMEYHHGEYCIEVHRSFKTFSLTVFNIIYSPKDFEETDGNETRYDQKVFVCSAEDPYSEGSLK